MPVESTILLSIFPLYNNYQNDKTQILFCYPTYIHTHPHSCLPLFNVLPLSEEPNLHPQVSANLFSRYSPATLAFLRQTGLKQTFHLGGPAQAAPAAQNVLASPPHSQFISLHSLDFGQNITPTEKGFLVPNQVRSCGYMFTHYPEHYHSVHHNCHFIGQSSLMFVFPTGMEVPEGRTHLDWAMQHPHCLAQ